MRTKVGSNEGSVKICLWALSATYFFIYVLLLLETKACTVNDGALISTNWFLGFWDQFFACRTISELGDALAGAFAPVAFIWLAGAVFIQSQELSETREVMQQQLEATRAQVEETKASTALLKVQTALFEQQHEYRLADDEIDQMLIMLRVALSRPKEELFLRYGAHIWGFEINLRWDATNEQFFDKANARFSELAGILLDFDFVDYSKNKIGDWDALRVNFEALTKSSERCSPAHSRLLSGLHLHTMFDLTSKVVEKLRGK